MHRLTRTARAVAGVVLRPSRWPEARKHVARAWNGGRTRTRPTYARLVRTEATPRRSVRAVVLLTDQHALRLEPEWIQSRWSADAAVADADLYLAEWPWPRPDEFETFVAAANAAGAPLVVWDTANRGETIAPGVPVDRVVVSDARRSEDYGGAPVAPGLVQPRWFNPVRSAGKVGALATVDLDGPNAGYAPRSRRYTTISVTGGSPVVPEELAAAAATGAVVLADPDIPGAFELSSGPGDQHLLKALSQHGELQRRLAHRTLRAAMQSYSTTSAASTMLEVAAVHDPWADRSVSAVVPTMRPGQIAHVMEFVARQADVPVQLVLVTHGFEASAEARAIAREHGVADLVVLEGDASLTLGALMNVGVEAADGRYVSKMDDDNFYGRHYLADLVRTFDFTDAQVSGKWAHYAHLEASGATFLRFPGAENKYVDLVQGGTITMPRAVAIDVKFEDLPRRVDTTFLEKVTAAGGRVYSADRYNFVSVRSASTDGHTWKISDSELLAKPSTQLYFAEPWKHVEI